MLNNKHSLHTKNTNHFFRSSPIFCKPIFAIKKIDCVFLCNECLLLSISPVGSLTRNLRVGTTFKKKIIVQFGNGNAYNFFLVLPTRDLRVSDPTSKVLNNKQTLHTKNTIHFFDRRDFLQNDFLSRTCFVCSLDEVVKFLVCENKHMEKLVALQVDQAEEWPKSLIKQEKPWFRLASLLGEGENCAVYSLGHAGKELVYTDSESDSGDESMSGDSEDGGSTCSCTSCETSEGESRASIHVDAVDGDDGHAECKSSDSVQRIVNLEDIRVHADTSAGRVQVVAKVFKHLDDDVGYGLYDSTENIFLKWFVDEEEAADYMRRRHFTSPRFRVQEVKFHTDTDTVRFSDFEHESLSNLFVTKFVELGLTPHVTAAVSAVEHKNTGYLLLERVQCTMDDLLADEYYEYKTCGRLVEAADIASLFFQAVFGLYVLQDTCQLKHHDLHTGNVFLKTITPSCTFRGQSLHDATHFHYKLNEHNFYLPNCGALAKLGDFAMASFDIHGKRMQRVDMDAFNDNVEKWGYWNAQYQEERGYDTQFLFADVPVDGRHRKNHALYKFLKTIRSTCMGKRGRVTPKKFRPMPGYISNAPADAVLATVFVKKVLPEFYFLTPPPEGSRVVTLGSSDWLQQL